MWGIVAACYGYTQLVALLCGQCGVFCCGGIVVDIYGTLFLSNTKVVIVVVVDSPRSCLDDSIMRGHYSCWLFWGLCYGGTVTCFFGNPGRGVAIGISVAVRS